MRPGISITLTAADRRLLETIVHDRNAPQKHVWRARIVLLSGEGMGTHEIMRRTGKSKTCVWRWQERFAEQGVEGLLRDKTRPSRIPPLGQEVIRNSGERFRWDSRTGLKGLGSVVMIRRDRTWRSWFII